MLIFVGSQHAQRLLKGGFILVRGKYHFFIGSQSKTVI